jgi:hypothetical protein
MNSSQKEEGTRRFRARALVLVAVGLVVTASAVALSQDCAEGLICFEHSTPAKASEVNANFKAIVPAGTVIFFNGAACPTGYAEHTAARGRYLVGLQPGGTLGGTAGAALGNVENRPAGEHTHSYSDGKMTATTFTYMHGSGSYANSQANNSGYFDTARTTGNGDSLGAGTNAPYLQLLVCEKQ